jgi:hypothetical protein
MIIIHDVTDAAAASLIYGAPGSVLGAGTVTVTLVTQRPQART